GQRRYQAGFEHRPDDLFGGRADRARLRTDDARSGRRGAHRDARGRRRAEGHLPQSGRQDRRDDRRHRHAQRRDQAAIVINAGHSGRVFMNAMLRLTGLAVAAALTLATPALAADVTIRFSCAAPPSDFLAKALDAFKAEVEKANVGVKVETYPG